MEVLKQKEEVDVRKNPNPEFEIIWDCRDFSHRPRISVVLPVFNCGKTVREALDSVFSQTYNDFELLICDDGSRDDTLEIVKETLKEKERNGFLVIKKNSNSGICRSLNILLSFSSGEFIARMDGDDISCSNRFSSQIAFLEENPKISFCGSRLLEFSRAGEFLASPPVPFPSKYDLGRGYAHFLHASVMFRREALMTVGGYSEKSFVKRCEDRFLWFSLYRFGFTGGNIDKVLYKVRLDENAISRRKFRWRINEFLVQLWGWKQLHLPVYFLPFCLRPLIVGLIPLPLYSFLKLRFRKARSA